VQLISWLYQIGVGLFNISEACNKRAIILTDVKEREEKKDKKVERLKGTQQSCVTRRCCVSYINKTTAKDRSQLF
jgi:hypothetical protein